MKSKLRQMIPKVKTKKGLSLVELIVGVTIIAMVLASASGAIVTGYKTTIDNASRNRAAALSASMNETILKAIKNCGLSNKREADDLFFWNLDDDDNRLSPTTPNAKANEPVYAAVNTMYLKRDGELSSQSVYYSSTDIFLEENGSWQYTLDTSATHVLEDASGTEGEITIRGVKITTAVASAVGFEEVVSFVPYSEQLETEEPEED